MPTVQDWALFNQGADSLTRTLLQKQVLKQQAEERAAAQRTADERTAIAGREASANDAYRQQMGNAATRRADAAAAGKVSALLEDDAGNAFEFNGSPEGFQALLNQAETQGKTLKFTPRKTATSTPRNFGSLKFTGPDGSETTVHAGSLEELKQLQDEVAKMPKNNGVGIEWMTPPPNTYGYGVQGGKVVTGLVDTREKKPGDAKVSVTEEVEPETVTVDGLEKPNPKAGQMRVKSKTVTGPREAVEKTLLDRQVAQAGAKQGQDPDDSQPDTGEVAPLPKDRKLWQKGRKYRNAKGAVATWDGKQFVTVTGK